MRPPRKKKRQRFKRVAQRVFHTHRQWVRGRLCSVPNCAARDIEFSHMSHAEILAPDEKAGTGIKAHDKCGVSLCSKHHREWHQFGAGSFDKKYQIHMSSVASNTAFYSPHKHLWENDDDE